MRRSPMFFIIAYFLYVPGVFGAIGLGVFIADKYVDTSENPLPGWLMIVLLAVVIGGPALWYSLTWNRPTRAERRLLKSGARGTARITDVSDTGISMNGGLTIFVKLTLDVHPSDGSAAFESKLETGVSRVSIYRPGETVPVRYDPANHHSIVLDDNATADRPESAAADYSDIPPETSGPATASSLATLLQSVSASRPEVAGRLESVIEGLQHGTIQPGVVVLGGDGQPMQLHAGGAGEGLAGQLSQLDQLHRSGGLSDAEYQAAKAKLLA